MAESSFRLTRQDFKASGYFPPHLAFEFVQGRKCRLFSRSLVDRLQIRNELLDVLVRNIPRRGTDLMDDAARWTSVLG